MIALLTGIIRAIEQTHLILDVNGVGYEVAVTTQTASMLGPIGSTASLQIITHVREDAITLFGFATKEDKAAFSKLTTIQGVGAKMALSLLSAFSPEQIWRAIVTDDKKTLTSADGVGPKLAARLVTELEDYASKQLFPSAPSISSNRNTVSAQQKQPIALTPIQEAISALTHLGYSTQDATRAVSMVANDDSQADLNTLIKHALREIAS